MAIHNSAITTAWSRLRESAFGTARAFGDDWRRIISDSRQVATDSLSIGNDAGYETGVDLPTEYWGETASTEFPITPKFNFQDIGYQLDLALGGYAVSGPDGGLYTHTFTPQDSGVSRQLVTRTGMKEYGDIGLELYPGMFSTAFSITFGKMGRISTSQTLMGNGDIEEDPASYTMPDLTAGGTREYGYASQASGISIYETGVGTRQVETATAAGTATTPGDATLTLTASGLSGSPLSILVTLAGTENAAAQAALYRTALRANAVVSAMFEVTGATTAIILTKWAREANDVTLNLAIAAGSTGITAAPTSANTTAGVVGSSESLGCLIEEATLTLNTPLADDGYRICSSYLDPTNPMSGQLRAEALFGIREMTLSFNAREDGVSNNLRTWRREQTDLTVEIPIIGTEANDYSLRISHARARVIDSTRISNAGGDFIGKQAQIALLGAAAGDGSIPLTITLVNNVASYAS
jgi:hypothetical protein